MTRFNRIQRKQRIKEHCFLQQQSLDAVVKKGQSPQDGVNQLTERKKGRRVPALLFPDDRGRVSFERAS